ncbi:hypothetical protein [Microvirga terricola]|uniref:Uncharacterized protein n=1 Tax=Microvirga terricola TaxID=2719797 RepID=A0ABX0VAD1_9HYPH|nr:hypothetical protein [Microvirga terricola]NIX76810.1 hypothetical protein [Microvirga terricola]
MPILDVFRYFNRLEDHHDLTLLDGPEGTLAASTGPDLAKTIVSDALLLAFSIARQRRRPLDHHPVGSRRGTLDEYCLVVLMIASRLPDSSLATEAASALGLDDAILSLVADLMRQIDRTYLYWRVPSLAEFRAVIGNRAWRDVEVEESLNQSGFRFRF